ncbi:MAG: hypothetical protein QXO71_00655 [Candidatus Jordarchaeaceae archaeon]
MPELKISNFKMFEKAPYDKLNLKNLIEMHIAGAKEREKIYGPAFTTEFIKYVLKIVTKETGKNPPEGIKTIDQLKDYLITKTEELSSAPYLILIGAEFVIDKKFEGSLAVGTQLMYKGITRKAAEADSELKLKSFDVEEILARLRKLAVDLGIAPLEFGYRKNPDETIDIYHGDCFYFEGCKMSLEQNLLRRRDGSIFCGATSFVCQFLKMGTKCEWDYKLIEFSESHCIARCFMI